MLFVLRFWRCYLSLSLPYSFKHYLHTNPLRRRFLPLSLLSLTCDSTTHLSLILSPSFMVPTSELTVHRAPKIGAPLSSRAFSNNIYTYVTTSNGGVEKFHTRYAYEIFLRVTPPGMIATTTQFYNEKDFAQHCALNCTPSSRERALTARKFARILSWDFLQEEDC